MNKKALFMGLVGFVELGLAVYGVVCIYQNFIAPLFG